jgi:hypothetical protein
MRIAGETSNPTVFKGTLKLSALNIWICLSETLHNRNEHSFNYNKSPFTSDLVTNTYTKLSVFHLYPEIQMKGVRLVTDFKTTLKINFFHLPYRHISKQL